MRCAGVSGKMKNACVTAHTLHTSYGLLVMKAKIKMQYINIIILTISLFFIDLFRIFSKEIQSTQNETFREAVNCCTGLSFVVIILWILYQKSKEKSIKYAFIIMNGCLIILSTWLFLHPFVSIFSYFPDHKGEVYQTFIWSSIAFACGLITSCIYYKISKVTSFFLLTLAMIAFIFLNTFSGFPWVEQAPFFTGIYCLFGSFLGSELCSICETKKQDTE